MPRVISASEVPKSSHSSCLNGSLLINWRLGVTERHPPLVSQSRGRLAHLVNPHLREEGPAPAFAAREAFIQIGAETYGMSTPASTVSEQFTFRLSLPMKPQSVAAISYLQSLRFAAS
ncbi:MAG: hypothetical protein R2688_08090 [Fimbriimonadaceae bacterium]